ncbi:MAG: LPS export ABC transporter periplasmic protein LptC [Pseudomonadales bacterium]|nr:LPS export ABC transporter periplasmic protein LptC [Pseudomonadales bacterium]
MSSRLIFFLTLLLAAVVSLLVNNNRKLPQQTTQSTNQYPEYIAVEPVTVQFNDQGLINHNFRGRLFTHYLESATTEVLEPELVIYRDADEPWHLRANKGSILENGETVLLNGDVQLWQTRSDIRQTELATEMLILKPQDKYAETDKPVMIKTLSSQTQATGMKTWLDKEYIELVSGVSGHHEF